MIKCSPKIIFNKDILSQKEFCDWWLLKFAIMNIEKRRILFLRVKRYL